VKDVKLPIALEKVLAFKDARVSQVGMKPDDLERVEKGYYFHAFNDCILYCIYDSRVL